MEHDYAQSDGSRVAPASEEPEAEIALTSDGALFLLFDRLFRASSLSEIFDAAVDGITSTLGSDRAALLLADGTGQMRFADWRGLPDGYRSAVDGHSPWRRGDRNAEPIYVDDVRTSDLGSLRATILSEGIASVAFVPLTDVLGVFGKLMLYYNAPHVFSPQEKQIAIVIARQVGFAIERQRGDGIARRLSAIVASSDDAIISKNLNGIITTWNEGAQRLFGYTAEEAIGQSVTILIPPDRQNEEPGILARIRAGERIDHYETVRQHKDGHLIDISLTVSPIVDGDGRIFGASKIARDISERRRVQEQQQLLMREMDHRVKNLFALASGIVRLSLPEATDMKQLAAVIIDRLDALAHAHALTISPVGDEKDHTVTSLHVLIEAILRPYQRGAETRCIAICGVDAAISSKIVTPLSLLLHEFATNAAKYGSLSVPSGTVEVDCHDQADELVIFWRERGGPSVKVPDAEGFGSRLMKSASRQVGRVERQFEPDGVLIEIVITGDGLARSVTEPN